MRWHRLQLLVDAVAEKQEEYGWVCVGVHVHVHVHVHTLP